MARGFVYLAAVMDWFSRRVLAWRVSITMEVDFGLDAVDEALARHGRPEICNTDQGSQFTSAAFIGLLAENAVRIGMDGRGSWRDNVFVERLWRSVKYEEVYLRAYDTGAEARNSMGVYLGSIIASDRIRALTGGPRITSISPALQCRRRREFRRRCGASLRSGYYALPTWCPATAIGGADQSGIHLSGPKRRSDQPGHLFRLVWAIAQQAQPKAV
jgi:putative transposase